MVRPKSNLQFIDNKNFDRFLEKLTRRDAIAKTVHLKAVEACVMWRRGEDSGLQLTHHGESRIENVVKYDMPGRYRLITWENEGKRIPLMIGDKEEAERWLENNRGRGLSVNHETQRIELIPIGTDTQTTRAAISGAEEAPPFASGPVLSRLDPALVTSIGIPTATLQLLNTYVRFEDVSTGQFWDLLNELPFPSDEKRSLVIQVIALIIQGQVSQAHERVHYFNGRASIANENASALAKAIESGANSDTFADLSKLDQEELKKQQLAGGFTDWMLYLHRDQNAIVNREFSGPARLLGVSGSGKTSVLVHRANALAKKYPGQRVLIITLNSALADLLEHLVEKLCVGAARTQIEVCTIYDYCYRAVKLIDPDRLIEREDHRSGETLADCWSDFLEKDHARFQAKPIIDALRVRENGDMIDAHSYLLDELVWIRSGFGKTERDEYLSCLRPGRGITLPKYDASDKHPAGTKIAGFPFDTRPRILKLLSDYEEYMHAGGLLDEDGVSLEAFSIRNEIKKHDSLRVRCLLVDEVQDLSTVELAVLSQLPGAEVDGLFLTGDPVQKVFAKQHEMKNAGIDIRGRSIVLRTNYRNTKQILEAAYSIIDKFRREAPIPEGEILAPEYALRDGPKPIVYSCASSLQQEKLVMHYLELLPSERDRVCICCPSEAAIERYEKACSIAGYRTHRIRGAGPRRQHLSVGVKLSTYQDIKGYEFGFVFLVDMMDSELIPPGMPWEERWRVAFKVYVAMTRARDELIMSYVHNRSILMGPLHSTVTEEEASKFLE